ncbi:MAG: AAA family ATPase, partial [Planctomycetota bacterium]
MRLKKLVLDGFKSFGRKTEFTFEPGITSIVGPNGCGKSNVVDAFRWVLGISSAKAVRGDNMTDMIFDGAARLARAQYAQVSLTFDNADGFFHRISSPEIEISRKLTRDGKSQYFLNGEPCRLKDFKTLFQDTGIGVEAYSIIEQGKVDVLLSTDPTERRKIFEEAAGINRYKSQRHEAELRLARTEENLTRLTDIINEVKGQIRRVKTQATKAERWKEYTRELNALKTHRALREYRRLHADREKWLLAASKAARELEAHEEQLDKERSKALEAQGRFDELMGEMNQIRSALHEAEKKITQHETSLTGHKRRLDEIDERRRRMRHARVVSESQKENFSKRKAHSEQQLDELEREQAVHEATFNALSTREYDLRGQIEGKLANARERQEFIEQLNRRRDALSTTIAQLDADIRIAATDVEKLTRQLTEQDTRAGELERRIAELTSEATAAREKRDELVGLLQGAADAQAKLDAQIEEAVAARQAEAQALAADESRLATLREVFESNAMMGAGSKALIDDLRLGEKFRVRGRVSELIVVPDDLTRVVEAVLGPLGSAVVVGDDADAFGALEHLAKNKLGGAQLLSSDSLGKLKPPTLDLPDSAAPLADLCKAASREGKPVLQGLLGQMVLVKDLAAAQKLIAKLPETVGLVTRQAEVIRRPASFSGRPEAGGVISSRTQLAEVEKRVVERRLKLEDLDKALSDLRANRNPGADRQRELDAQRQQASLELGELESEKRHLEKEYATLEAARHQTRRDIEAAEEARDDAQDRLAEARTRLGSVEDEQMKAAATGDDGGDLTSLQEKHLHLQGELTDARVTLAEVSQRLIGHREALKHMDEGILMNERDMARLDEEARLLDDQEAESKDVIKTAQVELETLREVAKRQHVAEQARERDVQVLRQQVATGQMNLETALS